MEKFLAQSNPEQMQFTRDPIERLLTPADFLQLAGDEVERATRYDRPLSVAMLGLDGLPMTRKMDGKGAADQVLRTVVIAVADAMRGPDRTGLLGIGELGVLLPETSLKHAGEVAERLRTRIEATRAETDVGERSVTLSIGITSVNPRVRDARTFLMAACFELRRAQSCGRNRVCIAKPEKVRMSIPRSAQIH